VETFPRFKKEVFKLSDIFGRTDRLERDIRTMLLGEIVWHRLINMGKMFKDTFDVDFPEPDEMKDLLRAIDIRHDLVHRSGRTKEGVEHMITPAGIEKLIIDANDLVTRIDSQEEKFEIKKTASPDDEPLSF
jgi:hypothetical protein